MISQRTIAHTTEKENKLIIFKKPIRSTKLDKMKKYPHKTQLAMQRD